MARITRIVVSRGGAAVVSWEDPGTSSPICILPPLSYSQVDLLPLRVRSASASRAAAHDLGEPPHGVAILGEVRRDSTSRDGGDLSLG